MSLKLPSIPRLPLLTENWSGKSKRITHCNHLRSSSNIMCTFLQYTVCEGGVSTGNHSEAYIVLSHSAFSVSRCSQISLSCVFVVVCTGISCTFVTRLPVKVPVFRILRCLHDILHMYICPLHYTQLCVLTYSGVCCACVLCVGAQHAHTHCKSTYHLPLILHTLYPTALFTLAAQI